jgi:type IV pilus assembly protein PilE
MKKAHSQLIGKQKGFTLIELLVVIAIIGILSSLILAGVMVSRQKAKDANAVKSMSSLRGAVEIYYTNNGNSYLGICPQITAGVPSVTATTDARYDISVVMNAAYMANSGIVTCFSNANGYTMTVRYRATGASGVYCFDHRGNAGAIASAPGANVDCKGAAY